MGCVGDSGCLDGIEPEGKSGVAGRAADEEVGRKEVRR